MNDPLDQHIREATHKLLTHLRTSAARTSAARTFGPHTPTQSLIDMLRASARVVCSGKQADEHYRAYLSEISLRGETVIRMPDGLLHLEEFYVDDREQRWCFTDKGTPVFAGSA